MFALFVAYFLYGVTQAKVSQRPPISINKLRGLTRRLDDDSSDDELFELHKLRIRSTGYDNCR